MHWTNQNKPRNLFSTSEANFFGYIARLFRTVLLRVLEIYGCTPKRPYPVLIYQNSGAWHLKQKFQLTAA